MKYPEMSDRIKIQIENPTKKSLENSGLFIQKKIHLYTTTQANEIVIYSGSKNAIKNAKFT